MFSYFYVLVYENHNIRVVVGFKIVGEANILVFTFLLIKFEIREKK